MRLFKFQKQLANSIIERIQLGKNFVVSIELGFGKTHILCYAAKKVKDKVFCYSVPASIDLQSKTFIQRNRCKNVNVNSLRNADWMVQYTVYGLRFNKIT